MIMRWNISVFAAHFVGCFLILSMINGASLYFAYNRPQPENGRIYPLRVHYTTVYLTECEAILVGKGIHAALFCGMLVIAIVVGVLQPFKQE
jgi:hypothetical protein